MLSRRAAVALPLGFGIGFGNAVAAGPAAAARYTVVRVDTRSERLQMFWADASGRPYGGFAGLAAALAAEGRPLKFAMNAGMYQADLSPVGLLVEAGTQKAPLALGSGSGNFFLLPNGVFYLDAAGPHVVASAEYAARKGGSVQAASQSGPLLLRDGAVHPRFNPASASRLIRNGVGVRGAEALFVISETPVNFHEMALHFRDVLGCRDALYFDGVVSSLYSTELRRSDARARIGPMVGVTS